MCRVLTELRVDKPAAKRLLHFAYDSTVVRNYPALGIWAIRSWSASRGWQRGACMDVVQSVGHLSYRRAALAGFVGHSAASDLARVSGLARQNPDLAPAATLALGA